MIALAVVVAAATAIGVRAERRFGARAEEASARGMSGIVWLMLPLVAFFNMAALELDAKVGAGIAYGYAAVAVSLCAAYVLGRHVLHLSRPATGALMLVAALGNTGYLGLPFNAAVFGLNALPDAVAYDALVSGIMLITVGFSVGAAFGTVAERKRDRALSFLTRNPPLWATVAGLLAPDVLAPEWAVDASRVVVFLILPLGFFAVGVTLAAESQHERLPFPPPLTAAVAGATGIKLLLGPAVALGLSALVLSVRDPYLAQPAMASAINSLVVANQYGLDRPLCAGAIAWTTTIVVSVGLVFSLL